MRTIDDLVERSAAFDEGKSDFKAASISHDSGSIVVGGDFKTRLSLSGWALSQLCQRLGPPNPGYLQKCPPWLMSANLAYWQSLYRKPLLVRAYTDECRAILSAEYTPISNTVVLEMARDMLGDLPYRIIDSYVDPNRIHVKIGMADDEGGNHAIGCYLGNSEDGSRMLRVMPFVQRHSCVNSIMWSEGAFIHKHYRTTQAFLYGAMKEHLGKGFAVSVERLETLVWAETVRIPDIAQRVKSICKAKGLSQVTRDNILMGTENSNTLWGLVLGVSYAAHQDNIDYESRIDLERFAGDLLLGDRHVRQRNRMQAYEH